MSSLPTSADWETMTLALCGLDVTCTCMAWVVWQSVPNFEEPEFPEPGKLPVSQDENSITMNSWIKLNFESYYVSHFLLLKNQQELSSCNLNCKRY